MPFDGCANAPTTYNEGRPFGGLHNKFLVRPEKIFAGDIDGPYNRQKLGARPTPDDYLPRFPERAAEIALALAFSRSADGDAPVNAADGPNRPRGADRNLLFGILALQMDFTSPAITSRSSLRMTARRWRSRSR